MSALLTAVLLACAAGAAPEDVYKQVRAEVEATASTHPWAGGYGNGGGLSGRGVSLAPSGRYCGRDWSDIGDGPIDCGRVDTQDGVRFALVEGKPWEHEGPPWTMVRWGERRYLVPDTRLLEFLNDINQGHEPSYERTMGGSLAAYLRGDDFERPVYGVPEFPELYRSMYRAEPVRATAVKVGAREHVISRIGRIEKEDCRAPARFDAGSAAGVFEGMELLAQSDDHFARGVIEEVGPDWSEGVIRQRDCETEDPVPQGTLFSSRAWWQREVALSSEPLSVGIRLLGEPAPPFCSGRPENLIYDKAVFAGAAAAGFTWREVAEITAKTSFKGYLELDSSREVLDQAVLAVGGNAYVSADDEDEEGQEEARAERTGYEKKLKAYRFSFRGRAIDPSIWFSFSYRDEGIDWQETKASARYATCASERAEAEGQCRFFREKLGWEDAMLARAHDVRFEELDVRRRAALAPLIPEHRRRGRVWPVLMEHEDDKPSAFEKALWDAGSRARTAFEKSHPGAARECSAILEQRAAARKKKNRSPR